MSLLSLPASAEDVRAARGGASCADSDHRGGDWPMMGHDLRHRRHQPKEKFITPGRASTLTASWEFTPEEGSTFSGTPAVAGGCVYVGSQSGWVYAINADTGDLVWKQRVEEDPEVAFSSGAGGINGSLALANGLVYASVANYEKPYIAALDQDTGDVLWATRTERQTGAGTQASAIVFGDVVMAGWDTAGIEFDAEARKTAYGGFAVIDARTGELLKRTYTIPIKERKKGYSGGNIWSSFAVDERTKYGYVGTAAPYSPAHEHNRTNAILKVDLDRSRPTFGEIVDSYKGVFDTYFESTRDLPCVPLAPGSNFAEGTGPCQKLDLDFAAAPNIMDIKGKTVVGELQKAGVYHFVDAKRMKGIHQVVLGNPAAGFAPSSIGSTAFDGSSVYAVSGSQNALVSLDHTTGDYKWFSETIDTPIHANPTSTANGVVYTLNGSGVLTAHDVRTGVVVLSAYVGSSLGSGVAVARNTVYTVGGSVIALRPDETREAQAEQMDDFLDSLPTPPTTPHVDKPPV
ncbi:MAG: PQQ-binding-like beta-propeller repeat protein [Actinomycetota bacterium]|nr:PQQ-binding-like beta-propeller repeat protein [Actinomycetota bacterium]